MTSTASGRVAAPIEIRGLTKTYKAVRAVNDLSFDVQAGSVTGLVGRIDAGKTTTLRVLLGLVSPTEGSATVNGAPMSTLAAPARTVGAVLGTTMHPARTPRAHLDIYATAIGLPSIRTTQVLSTVGLGNVADRKIGLFSRSMQARLALATALLGDPDILVLDEPARTLDPDGAAWLHAFLQTFAQSGRTVLMTGRSLRDVETVADYVVVLNGGSRVYEGSINSLRDSYRSRLLVACSNPALFATALAARGITDARITPDRRLVVSGTNSAALAPVAAASGVTIFDVVTDHADLDHLFHIMTAPPPAIAPAVPSYQHSHQSGYYGPAGYGPSGGER